MPLTHKDWDEILGRIKALIAQKGESFDQGIVVKRDLQRKLVWVEGFGNQPIPMYQFHSDVYVYDEWQELEIQTTVIGVSSYTYNTPANTSFLIVECIGPGGGGGGSSNTYPGGGGGAGAYVKKKISNPAASYAVVVGTGGNGGNTSGTNGSNGSGATTFSTLSAGAGHGGTGGATAVGAGGAGGAASGGDIYMSGGEGSPGASGSGGSGAASYFGAGSGGGTPGTAGNAAGVKGAGGGGGGTGGRIGGAAADGLCVVTAHILKKVVRKKLVSATPQVPEVGDLVLIAHHLGSRELPKCLGILNSVGFANFDAGLE